MKSRITTGLLAGVLAVMMPWLLMGMGAVEQEKTDAIDSESTLVKEEAFEEERRVREIVVHEKGNGQVDEDVVLNVEVEGENRELTLRGYLIGVLMGEMPAEFPLEALKAQAVAARTFTLRRVEQGGILSDDPAVCQAYTDPGTAEAKWGENWEEYLTKITQAVEETDGQVLYYNGALISATYFSCSGGKTESAQAVWGGEIPYLVSVNSPGEENSTAYESSVSISMADFLTALEIETPSVSQVTYTEGGGVDTMVIGGKTVSGTEMRQLFGLKSTLFSMEISENAVVFYVQGFGHRVGMSQYGAKAMAEAGRSYEEILKWYYTGVEMDEYTPNE